MTEQTPTGRSKGPHLHFNTGPGGTRDLDNLFTYHPPHGDQVERYQTIREAGLEMANTLVSNAPASSERSTALAKIREAVMWANAAVACSEAPASGAAATVERQVHLSTYDGQGGVACGVRLGVDDDANADATVVTCKACRDAQRQAGICVTCGLSVIPHAVSGHKVTNIRPFP